ncbi:MAG: hypothetical protein MI724_17920 [Spirochaetales bacterium]|nr:hypothetical protein [Spirochaetales bacterium]
MLSHSIAPGTNIWFPLDGPENDIAVFSTVELARNLSTIPFPQRMTDDDEVTLRRCVEDSFHHLEHPFRFIDPEQLSPRLLDCYRYRGYLGPNGSGGPAVVHDDGGLFVRLRGTDHLRIASYGGGAGIADARGRCDELDGFLERNVEYAVSLQLGYLSPEIQRVGAGLGASMLLHMAALEQSEGIEAIRGETSERVHMQRLGGLYRISCRSEFGEREETTLSVLAEYGERLVHYEREARGELVRRHGDALSEAAHRAMGTLLHARRLSWSETSEMLSLLRLAVGTGLMESVRLNVVTELMFVSHDSQVAVLCDDDGSVADVRRARLLQSLYADRANTGD